MQALTHILTAGRCLSSSLLLQFSLKKTPFRLRSLHIKMPEKSMYNISVTGIDDCKPGRYVDLRSDTFTSPTPEMRKAMFEAEVGDDVVGEDPTINALQDRIASLLRKEAAIFTPSGTMSNLIAVLAHCHSRGDSVLIGDQSHILLHEDGGVAELGGVMVHTIPNKTNGTFDVDEMERNNRTLVCIENTFNGCVLPLDFIDEVSQRLSKTKTTLHVDGARLFNAAVYLNVPPFRLVEGCESVSVCLSKGLGAPVGSLLVGSKQFIKRAHRLRHLLGGAMRQVGVLGAPGLVALDTGIDRLAEDHRRMQAVASGAGSLGHIFCAAKVYCTVHGTRPDGLTLTTLIPGIQEFGSPTLSVDLEYVQTNIAILNVNPKICTARQFLERIQTVTKEEKTAFGESTVGIKCYDLYPQQIRFVTYNAITDKDVRDVCKKLEFVCRELERKSTVI